MLRSSRGVGVSALVRNSARIPELWATDAFSGCMLHVIRRAIGYESQPGLVDPIFAVSHSALKNSL